jgi:quercetin dioxygenase-like cupin family protein
MMINEEVIQKNWKSRGFSFGVFEDPPGQIWKDFTHKTDELFVLAQGEIEVQIEGVSQRPAIGQEILIPKNAIHTVINTGVDRNRWFYGYYLDPKIFLPRCIPPSANSRG